MSFIFTGKIAQQKNTNARKSGRSSFHPIGKQERGSAAAAVVRTAYVVDEVLQRTVLAHAVSESDKNGPAAALERIRREDVPARSENEQDDKDPETAIAAKTAIHSFSSYSFPANGRLAGDRRRVCNVCFLRPFVI